MGIVELVSRVGVEVVSTADGVVLTADVVDSEIVLPAHGPQVLLLRCWWLPRPKGLASERARDATSTVSILNCILSGGAIPKLIVFVLYCAHARYRTGKIDVSVLNSRLLKRACLKERLCQK